MTIKKYLKIYSLNPLYLIFRYVNGYFEEINQNMYLTLVCSNESKEKSKKYKKLWIKIRGLIGLITKNLDDFDEKFNSDDKLPLNKKMQIPTITIVVRAVFLENSKYYPQVFLDEILYKI